MIRRLEPTDAVSTAAVHWASFQRFFLTSLGPRFLRQFYASILGEADGLGVGAFNDQARLEGFAVGTLRVDGFYRRLARRRALRLGLAAAPALCRHPGKLVRIVRSLRGDGSGASTEAASLLSLAVDPSVQGGGLGARLVEAFVAACRERGARLLTLTTDADNNDAVNRFYRRNGFQCESTIAQADGRRMNRYVMELIR